MMLPIYSSHYIRERRSLELLQFIHKYNLWNSVPNIVIMLRIFLTIAVSVATCEQGILTIGQTGQMPGVSRLNITGFSCV